MHANARPLTSAISQIAEKQGIAIKYRSCFLTDEITNTNLCDLNLQSSLWG